MLNDYEEVFNNTSLTFPLRCGIISLQYYEEASIVNTVKEAVDQKYSQLRKLMDEELDRFADELWADQCNAERDAGVYAANQSLIYGGRDD